MSEVVHEITFSYVVLVNKAVGDTVKEESNCVELYVSSLVSVREIFTPTSSEFVYLLLFVHVIHTFIQIIVIQEDCYLS